MRLNIIDRTVLCLWVYIQGLKLKAVIVKCLIVECWRAKHSSPLGVADSATLCLCYLKS